MPCLTRPSVPEYVAVRESSIKGAPPFLSFLAGAWRQAVPLAVGAAAVLLVGMTLPSLPASNPYASRAPGAAGSTPQSTGSGLTGATPSPLKGPGALIGPSGAVGSINEPNQGANGGLGQLTGCANGGETYPGTSCNRIKTVFNYQQPGTSCGQDLSGALVALGVANANPAASLDVLVPYFNSPKAAEIFPEFASVLRNGYYGRYILREDVHDQGAFCDDQNVAIAKTTATENPKPFFVVGGCLTCGSEGSGDMWQQTLPQYGIPSIEGTQNSAEWYQQYAPYDWSLLVSGTTVVKQWRDLVCGYLKNHPSSTAPPDPATDPTNARIFSLSNIELPEETKLGNWLYDQIQKCGAKTGIHYQYKKDLSSSAAQAANYNSQMRGSNTTTVINYADAIATLIGSTEDGGTNYIHEQMISGFGFDDTDGITEQYASNQTPHWFGLGNDNEYEYVNTNYCSTWYGKLWCDKHPGTQPPSDYGIWAVDMELYASMLLLAGPNLTPQAIQSAMFSRCAPCPRRAVVPSQGAMSLYMPLIGFGPKYPDGMYSGVKDYVPVMWDPNKHSDYVAYTAQSNQHPGQGVFMPWGEPAGSPFAKDFPYSFPAAYKRYRFWGQPS